MTLFRSSILPLVHSSILIPALSLFMANRFSESPEDAAVLQSMTLLATLQTAFDVWQGVEGRRAGRDPSVQEPPEVTRPYLRVAADALQELRLQLAAGRMLARRAVSASEQVALGRTGEASLAASVRHFDLLMKPRHTERVLQGAHQRLMSLYPEVEEALVEEVREAHHAAERLLDAEGDAFLDALPIFLNRLAAFITHLRQALRR